MTSGNDGRRLKYVGLAIAAAALYALSVPLSKLLMGSVDPGALAGLLYLGAGAGMWAYLAARHAAGLKSTARPMQQKDTRYVIGMVILDIAAPLLLMGGLASSAPESVSLLNNFEIVATALVARALFGEIISAKLWAGIAAMTTSCALLTIEPVAGLALSSGSLLVLGACLCWGIENNCTAAISDCDPALVVAIKGIGSGMGALCVALLGGSPLPALVPALLAMALGFASYGLSILAYVTAQRGLGAARTSAYYAVGPFIGVAVAWLIFGETPGTGFVAALVLMALGSWLSLPEG
ncbi:MAG: DMT family transporter [Atopobiaceae bacterium]|nr:DMT family transporter [Atopobiaceae bacterium]